MLHAMQPEEPILKREFGPWLRELRRAADLTQEQLAERVAVDVTTIRKYERGERRPTVPTLRRLAEVLTMPEADREAFVLAGRAALAASVVAGDRQAEPAASQDAPDLPPITFYIIQAPPPVPPMISTRPAPAPGSMELLTGGDLAPIQLLRLNNAPLVHWPQRLARLPAPLRRALIVIALLLLFSAAMLASAWYRNRGQAAIGEVQLAGQPDQRVVLMTARGRIRTGDSIRVGEPVTVSFSVLNVDTHWVLLKQIVAGSQGPGAQPSGWDAPGVDFPHLDDVWIAPGETVLYRQAKIFTVPGRYFVEPVIEDAVWRWGGIGPFTPTTRVLFEVLP